MSRLRIDPIEIGRTERSTLWHAIEEDRVRTFCGLDTQRLTVKRVGASWTVVKCRMCKGGW